MRRVVIIKLRELLLKKGMTIRKLSLLSDVRPAAICDLVNHKRINVHLHHLTRIADALEIDDINQIITIVKIED